MKEIPEELSAAVYSLHGTLTSPKEMVADPIARGAIVWISVGKGNGRGQRWRRRRSRVRNEPAAPGEYNVLRFAWAGAVIPGFASQ